VWLRPIKRIGFVFIKAADVRGAKAIVADFEPSAGQRFSGQALDGIPNGVGGPVKALVSD
jgi:hypothetical protein